LYRAPVPSVFDNARKWLGKARCCPPPPKVTGLTAQPGGGSGEVVVTWDPLPASAHVAFYRVYERKGTGLYWHLAVVTPAALGALVAGRIGVVDAADYWPWPSAGVAPGPRCFAVTAISTNGLEGPMSDDVCGSAPGGP
jgi:hypothetical protein